MKEAVCVSAATKPAGWDLVTACSVAKNATLRTHGVVGPRSVMVPAARCHRLASRVQAKYSMGLALPALFL